MHHRNRKRMAGNAIMVVLVLLVVVGGALGLNYVRNYQVEQKEQKSKRPYVRYKVADLEILAEGYRMELAAAEKRYASGSRVETRQRHHFKDQINEFERVQKAAHGARDKALEIAETRSELQKIEAEQQRRAAGGDGIAVHLARMFRI